MKKLLLCMLSLLLFALPALADLGFREEGLPDGSTVLHFDGLDMTLPAGWEEKVLMIDGETGLSFYHAASYKKYLEEGIEGGGYLFTLNASREGSFSELPAFKYLGFSENAAMNYYMALPSDYPAWMGDDAIRAEYDKLFAQVDTIAVSVIFPENVIVEDGSGPAEQPIADGMGQYDAGGIGGMTADSENGEESAAQAVVSLERIRYHFEHSAMPRFFYEDPATVLDVLEDVGVFPVFAALANENGVAYPYQEADFKEYLYNLNDGTVLLQVVMPQPEKTPQCYRIYMVYNSDTGNAGYYTVEFDNMLVETAFLCGWKSDMTHLNYGGAAILNPEDDDYRMLLAMEAAQVAELAGASGTVNPVETAPQDAGELGLVRIECPEQGFTTLADPAYATKYQEGTGVYIYTEEAGRIPYVIVFRSEDLLGEPLEYIKEQYTPHMQAKYGNDLIAYVEYEIYEIGGKQLPAGLYTYRLQGHIINALRVYDSTGDTTVVYTAKYENGLGDSTLQAMDAAIRGYQAQ